MFKHTGTRGHEATFEVQVALYQAITNLTNIVNIVKTPKMKQARPRGNGIRAHNIRFSVTLRC